MTFPLLLQLVEPGTCVEEQLAAGVTLLADGAGACSRGSRVVRGSTGETPMHLVVLKEAHGVPLSVFLAADVVRYRHRKKAGRPNWAERFFKGHEEDAFYGRQPNLACNHQ